MNTLRLFRFLLLSFTIVILDSGCGHKKTVPVPVLDSDEIQPEFPIFIQLSKSHRYMHTFNLTDIASEVKYIPLETNPTCFIGSRYSIPKFTKDFIFIETGGIVLEFDWEGKFIRRINKHGQGPEECYARDFDIDENNHLIHIFDNWNLSVYTFNFEGKYIKTLRNPFSGNQDTGDPVHMGCDDRGNLFFSFYDTQGNTKYKYIVTDKGGNIIYKCPNYIQFHLNQQVVESTVPFYPLYRFNSSCYYEYSVNDTIFVINEDYSCSPVYIRNLPNRVTLEDVVKTGAYVMDYSELSDKNKYAGSREDKKYLYLYHTHNPYSKDYISLLSLYEKRSGKLIENINPQISNDWDGGIDIKLDPSKHGENLFCFILQPFKMKETLTEEHFANRSIKYPDKSEALRELVSNIQEDDNPVLMIIKN